MVTTRRHPDGGFPEPAPSSSTSTRTHSPSPRNGGYYAHPPSRFITLWLLVSLPLVIWDTGYISLRPHSMPGGSLHSPIWRPYAIYAAVDYVYGWPAWHARSGFTAAQASLNVAETVGYGFYLWVVWGRARGGGEIGGAKEWAKWLVGLADGEKAKRGEKKRDREEMRLVVQGPQVGLAVVVLFAAAVMTVSKTVLYGLNEYFSGWANIGHNGPLSLILYWILPNGAWIVFPTYMVYVLGREIVNALEGAGKDKK